MGKSSGSQTVSQDPWGPAQGNLRFGLNQLNNIYGRLNPGVSTPNISQSVSPFGFMNRNQPQMTQMNPMMNSQPGQFGQPGQYFGLPGYGLLDPAAQQLRSTIQGQNLFSNPNLDEVIRRASADVNSQFEGAGRYGSGSHMDALFSRAAAPIRYQDYARERQNQLSAIQAAPGMEMAPYQLAMAPYQLYSAQQAAPYEGISNYLNLSSQIGRGGGTQSSPIYKNPLIGALGGGLGGYAAGGSLGTAYAGSAIDAAAGAGASFGPWGAIIGALAGGLL